MKVSDRGFRSGWRERGFSFRKDRGDPGCRFWPGLEVAASRPVGGELRPLATEGPGGKHRVTSHQLFIDGPCIGLAYKWVSS